MIARKVARTNRRIPAPVGRTVGGMVSSDRMDEWVHELRVRTLVCRAEAEMLGEVVVLAHCDEILARLDVVWAERVPDSVGVR